MTKLDINDVVICPSCMALVFPDYADKHQDWHNAFLYLASKNEQYEKEVVEKVVSNFE